VNALPEPGEITSSLRAHLARHNARVLLLSAATLAAAIVLWAVLYVIAQWLTLLALVIVRGADTPLPRGFPIVFGAAMLCLLAYAWIDRRLTPNDMPRDEKSAGEIAEDFLLAIPRTTLAAWSTLTAWQWLSAREFSLAASLLERLSRERRVAVHSLPIDIPEDEVRWRILFALQLTQLVDLRRDGRDYWIVLNPLRPPNFALSTRDR
jgi:hypothetical protein